MNLELLTICDAATEHGGKLNILGAFDAIYARELPAKYPLFLVVARIRYELGDPEDQIVAVSLVTPEGELAHPRGERVFTLQHNDEAPSQAINIILGFQNVELHDQGDYSISCEINGRSIASVPLFVRQIRASKEANP